jgi:hypothetical protein
LTVLLKFTENKVYSYNKMTCKQICLIEDNNNNGNVSENKKSKKWIKLLKIRNNKFENSNDHNNYNFETEKFFVLNHFHCWAVAVSCY